MNGFVLYAGPSALDGAPIICIATGLKSGSSNTKTGAGIVQTWILRADVSPAEAVNSGADASICGECPHRGTIEGGRNVGRSCYVTIFQAPRSVFDSFKRGIYPMADAATVRAAFAGRIVRLGAYGDPAAVPFAVWSAALADVAACTGYTHQWRTAAAAGLSRFAMASCDTPADYADATAAGWRTFRVRTAGEAIQPREVVCPASKEAGQRTTCDACKACGGHSAKARANIVILAHGTANKVAAFTRRAA